MNEAYKEEIKDALDKAEETKRRNQVVKDLLRHRAKVSARMSTIAYDLSKRGRSHDNTLTSSTEMSIAMQTLSGTPEQIAEKKKLLDAIHGSQSDYDPRYYQNGLHEMNLNQLIEFICDKMAKYEEMYPQQLGDDAIIFNATVREYTDYVLSYFDKKLPDVLNNLIENTIAWMVDSVGYTKSLFERKEMEINDYVKAEKE